MKNKFTTTIQIITTVASLTLLTGYSGCNKANVQVSTAQQPTVVTPAVATHNQPSDCWTIFEGQIYDITNYVLSGQHNPSIEKACGVDSTQMFLSKHQGEKEATGRNILKNLPIIKI
ncbi:MAG: cytochrome b5 domain-containing protein [Candidatus Magasanikbacteria bacterium]|jgi:cytochrome b involved in lipid metabolism